MLLILFAIAIIDNLCASTIGDKLLEVELNLRSNDKDFTEDISLSWLISDATRYGTL